MVPGRTKINRKPPTLTVENYIKNTKMLFKLSKPYQINNKKKPEYFQSKVIKDESGVIRKFYSSSSKTNTK